MSKDLVKNFAEGLGVVYLSASCKTEFLSAMDTFVKDTLDKPVVFECFSQVADDRAALVAYNKIRPFENRSLSSEIKNLVPSRVKNVVKAALGR